MSNPGPWNRFAMPLAYWADTTGTPLAGGKLYFFVTGTSQPLDTYADVALSRPNTNPVLANQAGVWPPIFLANSQYKVVLTDAGGTTIWEQDPVSPFIPDEAEQDVTVVIEMTVDGNGQVPQTGVCADLYVPFACTLVSAVLQADQAGDVVVDVWAAPFVTNTPPNSGNSICASDLPTLTTSQSSIDTVLTGWDTAIDAGTAMRFNIVSVDTLTRFTLSLTATRVAGE